MTLYFVSTEDGRAVMVSDDAVTMVNRIPLSVGHSPLTNTLKRSVMQEVRQVARANGTRLQEGSRMFAVSGDPGQFEVT